MAKKYIDAEAYFKLINTTLPYGELDYPDKAVYNAAISDMCDMLTHFPAADVQEIRRGRWEWHSEDTCFYCCSNCGHNAYGNTGEILSGYYNFCPNCGAQMNLEENDG